MNKIPFHKMHSLGNDFVILNGVDRLFKPADKTIQRLANRHTGIGFDQLLIIERSNVADFFCRIYNADGTEAPQCGNGIRCVARFIQEEALSPKKTITIATKSGVIPTFLSDGGEVEALLGIPEWEPTKIPFLSEKTHSLYQLTIHNKSLSLAILSVGNPHAILKVSDIDKINVQEAGEAIATHTLFPQGVNVGFMQVIDRTHIRLKTFERGAHETFACGSNACAAVAAGIKNLWLDTKVTVELKYGHLLVEWENQNQSIRLKGPTERVFSGEYRGDTGLIPSF